MILQVLSSGNLDMDYLGKILEFALITIQKLSAPASANELKATHQKFLDELIEICRERVTSKKSHTIALVRGVRFVLEQIQVSFILLLLYILAS